MEPTDKKREEILKRLKRIEGQVRGIQRMISEERDCADIVTQLLAVRSALDKVSLNIMAHHIQRCFPKGSTEEEMAQLERIISFFMRFAELDIKDEDTDLADELASTE